jgi:hypothetical protein
LRQDDAAAMIAGFSRRTGDIRIGGRSMRGVLPNRGR